MKDKTKRQIAGILDLLAGIAGLVSAFVVLFLEWYPLLAALIIMFAVIALIGGFSALSRKRWRLVLVGSISAVFASPIFGFPALVFAILSRNRSAV